MTVSSRSGGWRGGEQSLVAEHGPQHVDSAAGKSEQCLGVDQPFSALLEVVVPGGSVHRACPSCCARPIPTAFSLTALVRSAPGSATAGPTTPPSTADMAYVQLVTDPCGRLLWISPALPGRAHDLSAAPITGSSESANAKASLRSGTESVTRLPFIVMDIAFGMTCPSAVGPLVGKRPCHPQEDPE